MKRYKLLALMLVFVIGLGSFQNFRAYAYTNNSLESFFEVNGIDNEFLGVFSSKQISEIESLLRKSPNRVSVAQNVYRVDVLDEIRELYSNPLLLNNPKHQNVIKKLDELALMSAKEMSVKCGISISQAKIIKDFIDKQKSLRDKTRKKGNVAKAAGSITSAEMSTLFMCTDLCGMEEAGDGPLYRVYASFNWKKPFIMVLFQDVIVVAWGGGLNSRYEESSADYYTLKGYHAFDSWKKYDHTCDQNPMEFEPNIGVTFYFDQTQDNEIYTFEEPYYSKLRLAVAELDLYQDRFEGKSSKVVVQYGHAVVDFLGGSAVTIGAEGVGLSISFAKGFDKSQQLQKNIKY